MKMWRIFLSTFFQLGPKMMVRTPPVLPAPRQPRPAPQPHGQGPWRAPRARQSTERRCPCTPASRSSFLIFLQAAASLRLLVHARSRAPSPPAGSSQARFERARSRGREEGALLGTPGVALHLQNKPLGFGVPGGGLWGAARADTEACAAPEPLAVPRVDVW